LIENAVKYGEPNTTIVLTLTQTAQTATFSVTNNGITIPQSEHGHIFQKFYRAQNVTEETKGFGVGLYAVKQIVESAGGNISFESANNKTTFTVVLPRTHSQNHL